MADKGLVLVTGASGFVGKWTIIELMRAGFPVRGTVRSQAKVATLRKTLDRVVGQGAGDRLEIVTADLLSDAGWAEAMDGVTAVMHVAAQILGQEPKDPSSVVRPALEGTERVLKFAHRAGIKRVVMTSSIATVGYGHGHTTGKRVYDETHFTNLDAMKFTWAYCVGKTKAEQLAWSFAREHGMELTTVHPGAILGPAVDEDASISLGLVTGLLVGKVSALPSNGFAVVDVRDVAALQVAALEHPEAIGQRYLATSDYVPFPMVATILREAYPDREITQKNVPDWVIKIMARLGGPTRQIINDIGNEKHYNNSKAVALLGRKLISGKDAILASAQSSIELGLLSAPQDAAGQGR